MLLEWALSATGWRQRDSREPSVDQMLADPIVQAAMQADGVDPARLRAELVATARVIAERRERTEYREHID